MSGVLLPVILTVVGLITAIVAYQGMRRGGARYYTLEREALLRRAGFYHDGELCFSFLAAIGLLIYERQQNLPLEGLTDESNGSVLESVPPSDAVPIITTTPVVEQFPPTGTPAPTADLNLPTETPTAIICRGVVEGTSGNGLTLRDAPGGIELAILPDGTILTLLEEDPEEANGFVWRKVRLIGG